jgi:hypothetical protein
VNLERVCKGRLRGFARPFFAPGVASGFPNPDGERRGYIGGIERWTEKEDRMKDALTITRLVTRKNALGTTRVETARLDLPLQQSEVLLKVDRLAVTTNNIIYAAFGDAMQY